MTTPNPAPTVFWVDVVVDGGASTGDLLGWSFAIDGSPAGGNCQNNARVGTATIQGTPVVPANLDIDKSVDRLAATPGSQLTYTLTYRNTGNQPASNVVISDSLPAGTSFASATQSGSESGGTVSWQLGSVPGGSSGSVVFTVNVDPGVSDGTTLSNFATIDSDQTSPVDSPTASTLINSPVLLLSKTGPLGNVLPGQQFTYTLSYENSGSLDAANVTLTDVLPAGLNFVSASGNGSLSGSTITWDLGTVSAGATGNETLTVEVDAGAVAGTVLDNLADIQTGALVATSLWSVTVDAAPILRVTKTSSRAVVEPGDLVTYTITYENIGTADANNVEIVDSYPDELIPDSVVNNGTQPDIDLNAQTVTFDVIGALPPGDKRNVQVNYTVDSSVQDGDRIENAVVMTSPSTPLTANALNAVTVRSAPVLNITKTPSVTSANPGDTVTYTISFSNTGTGDATGVTLEDLLHPNTNLISATGSPSVTGDTLSWNIGTLARGASGSFDVVVEIDAGTPVGTFLNNTAAISSTNGGGVATTAQVRVVGSPLMSLDKSVSASLAQPGDQLIYRIDFSNNGTVPATNVVIEDTIPAGITLDQTFGATVVGNTLIWNVGSVPAGATGSVTFTATVDSPAVDGTVLQNNALLRAFGLSAIKDSVTTTIASEARFDLTKQASRTSAKPGDSITYTIQYVNSGTDTATAAVLEDFLPPDVTFVSASSNGSHSNGTVSWNLGDVAAGAIGSETVTVQVNSPLADGTDLINFANISSVDTGTVPANPVTVAVSSAPALTINKTVSKTTAVPGDTLTYRIDITNTGTDQATNVVVEDQLPALVRYISSIGQHNNGRVEWTIPVLAAGKTTSLTLVTAVELAAANGDKLRNSVSVQSDQTPPLTADSTPSQVIVSANPALQLTKTASATTVVPGQSVTFTMSYVNAGTGNAQNATLSDTLPPGLVPQSASNGGLISGQNVNWNLGDLPPWISGQVTVTAQVASPLPNNTDLINLAQLLSASSSTSATATVTVSSAPVLQVDKTVSRSNAQPGDNLTYTITYRNTGTDIATGVVLSDQLPPELSFSGSTGGGNHNGSGLVIWNLPDLPANSSNTVTLSATVNSPIPNGTVIHNSASIDSIETNAVASPVAPANVTINSAPALTISKAASVSQVTPGQRVSYTLTYENIGTDTASNLTLTDNLPPELTFISADSGAVFNPASGTVRWDIGTVDANDGGSVIVTAEVNAPLPNGLQIYNFATISGSNAPPVSSPPNQGTVTISSSPVLDLSKTVSATIANAGQQLVYTLNYANIGTANASGVVLQDTLPAGVTFVSASGGGTHNSGVVNWAFGSLDVGSPGSVTLTVQVDSPIANGTLLNNNASLTAGNAQGTTAASTTTVNSAPQLSIVKSVDKPIVTAGGQLVYTLDYRNTGTDAATNVVIEDALPASVNFISASNSGTFANGTVSWNFASLAAGASGSVILTGQANSPLANGTPLHNSATIRSDLVGPQSASADAVVSSAPRFTLDLTVDKASANPGATLLYRLQYRNIGSDAANSPRLQFTLPPNTGFVNATGGGTLSGGIVSWAPNSIPAGATGLFLVELTINSPLANGTLLSANASVNSAQTKPLGAGPANTTVTSSPVLTIIKRADRQQVGAGLAVTYTIDYANTGTDQATNVVIEDHLPTDATYVSNTGGGTHSGGVVTWNLGTVPANASGSLTVIVNANTPLPDGTVLHNTATIDSDLTQPQSIGPVDVTVTSQPELTMGKQVSAPLVAAGSQVTYTLVYENGGPAAATGTVLVDTVPPNTRFVSATAGGQYDAGNNAVIWNLGNVAPVTSGSVQATLEVLSPLPDGTTIANAAAIGADNATPQTATASVTVTSAPILTVNKSSPQANIAAGGSASYVIDVSNTGSDQAQNVVVVDRLPAGSTPSAITPAGTYNAASSQISWTLPTLDAGTALQFTYNLQAPLGLANGSPFLNSVDVTAQNAATVSDNLILPVQSAPVLTLSKVAPNSVEAGATLSYSLQYANTGNTTALAVTLEDVLPSGTSFVSASNGGTESGGTVRWILGDIAPGASGSVTLQAQADLGLADGSLLLNTASASGNNAQPVSASGSTVVRSHVELDLAVSGGPGTVDAGGQVAFLITYSNIGNQSSAGTQITATLPAGTTFAGTTGGGVYDSATNTVLWALGAIPPGPQASISLLVNVDAGLAGGTLLTTSVTATDGLAQPISGQASVRVSSVAAPTPAPTPVPVMSPALVILLALALLALAAPQLKSGRRHLR
ncbi:DUF11 domain-containing protein [Parahaliea maris]|uniref:DUF11 domain-containing protein n=1 Tax=Parahaliea maris TaxID=2716870 RepID=UPI00164F8D59|nr:DUF11 domain-containing protein [Parahaliea maris]